nr:nuclear transport factor 2 family protein [uncultured Roseateles sp.]
MNTHNLSLVERFWSTANAADWEAFAALLSTDLVYEVPQTRERVRGREDFVEFFRTWPGIWRVEIVQSIADAHSAVTVINFITPTEQMTGITFFELGEGTITRLTDYWPADYEPPQRASPVVKRY